MVWGLWDGPRPEGNAGGWNLAARPGVNQPEDEDMRHASLAGILAAAVLAARCLVEVEEEDGDQVLAWLR